MYNVRIIEYPTGFQYRFYDHPVTDSDDVDIDMETGEIIERVVEKPEKDEDSSDPERSVTVSMARTKQTVYYLARSNVWEWFITLTLDPAKIDRYDFKTVSDKVRKWFNHLKDRKCPSLYYLIVPETHQDGAWHFHGVIGGCDGLFFVDSGHKDCEGRVIYNFENWKFGFSTATRVTDPCRVSGYISKYITKSLVTHSRGSQRYWVSKNCSRGEITELHLTDEEIAKLRQELYEKMSWKKRTVGEFLAVEYFEIPKEG